MFKRLELVYAGKTRKQKIISLVFMLFAVLIASFVCTLFITLSGIWGRFAPNEVEDVFGMFFTVISLVVVLKILHIEYKE